MDDFQKRELHIVPPKRIESAAAFALTMLGIFLVILAVSSLKEFRFIGSGVTATNTITVSGTGEVFAVPDRATFSFTVMKTAKDVTTAQTDVNTKGNDIIAYLKSQGVDEKDIQTTDYSVNPHYEYSQSVCTNGYCPGRQTLTGYDVSETVTVKVKDPTKAGTLLSGIGSKGATNVSGLSFTVEDETALEAQARQEAIDDAREKAKELAKQLGVSLVRVVGFSENGRGGQIYYAKAMSADSGMGSAAAPAPEIATGQNKITSDVSVTYEIK
ncbi:SIMPL domain-containing protein [Candidatus Kaiserbacteria bacterium]|nr:SIMPL domain-containing protein [Candidatus Kaiserbacteria bacterium]